jgi:phage shock protein A
LEGYLSEGTEEMRRQIEFLIKQINSNEVQEEVDSDIEDGDEDEEVNSFNIFGGYDKRN